MKTIINELYINRCLEIAQRGAGKVAPNPMVGAVLVYEDKIIGEGWHQVYGGPHAEVNCINSVAPDEQHLIPFSTIYVSLEPCAHFGKTPPCAELIIKSGIKKVVVGCIDDFSKVAGKGIQMLKDANIEVFMSAQSDLCKRFNKIFFKNISENLPFITLKFAQSKDGYLSPVFGNKVMLSNKFISNIVQSQRKNQSGILVGYKTALLDNPFLSSRYYDIDHQPTRIVFDWYHQLPKDLNIFDQQQKTIIVNCEEERVERNIHYMKYDRNQHQLKDLLTRLYNLGIYSIIVEGGGATLQSFIYQHLWDEAYVITTDVVLKQGTAAPELKHQHLVETKNISNNTLNIYEPIDQHI